MITHHEQRMSELKAYYEANPVGAPEIKQRGSQCLN